MTPLSLPETAPLLPWYERNKRDLPWRATKDPYRIWVSEIMLQQTRVEAVIPYYLRFLEELPTVTALAAAPEEQLLRLWQGLGYYSRVRNMQKAARTVTERYGGAFPRTFDEVRALCGVGDYTAGAICSFAYGLPYPAVDGNVLRVAARLSAYGGDVLSPAARKLLTAAVATAQPADRAGDFNQAMIELGALVCLPNGTPRCAECPLAKVCAAHEKGIETTLPVRRKAAARRVESRTVLVLRAGDRVALAKRPETGLLASLFEPYCLPETLSEKDVAQLFASFGITPQRIAPLGAARHVFTHLEWRMTGFEVTLSPADLPRLPENLFFVPAADLHTVYALPTAYRHYL